jgi:hypothetical protein
LVLGSFSYNVPRFISLVEDRGKVVGGKVRIIKDETEKVKTIYFNHRNGSIDDEAVVQYLIGAMSDAAKRTPFVYQGLYRQCMKWHNLLCRVYSSFFSLIFHACMVHGY